MLTMLYHCPLVVLFVVPVRAVVRAEAGLDPGHFQLAPACGVPDRLVYFCPALSVSSRMNQAWPSVLVFWRTGAETAVSEMTVFETIVLPGLIFPDRFFSVERLSLAVVVIVAFADLFLRIAVGFLRLLIG